MKMKKITAMVTVAAMAACLGLAGCGSSSGDSADTAGTSEGTSASDEGSSAQSSGTVYEVSLSTPVPETNIVAEGIEEFVDLVNERTDGQVVITPFYSNVLGSQKDMFTAMANNEQELILDGSITDYYAKEYGFLFAPFIVRNADHLQAILDGDLFTEMEASLAENNIAVLGESIRGSRVLYSTKQLSSADDISKLVIRMPDLTTYIDAWSEAGASTQVMGGSDVYSALSTGVVNSCEGPYSQGVSDKYAEVTQYLYPTNHVTEPYFIYASQEWLDSLPDDLAQIVEDTASEVMDHVTELCAEDAESSLEELKAAGMTYDDSIDFSSLFESLRPMYEEKFESGEWTSSYDEVMSYYTE